MSDDIISEISSFDAPWGKQVVLQEIACGGELPMLRIRIREGRRFTIVDLDADTAALWGNAMKDWAMRDRAMRDRAISDRAKEK